MLIPILGWIALAVGLLWLKRKNPGYLGKGAIAGCIFALCGSILGIIPLAVLDAEEKFAAILGIIFAPIPGIFLGAVYGYAYGLLANKEKNLRIVVSEFACIAALFIYWILGNAVLHPSDFWSNPSHLFITDSLFTVFPFSIVVLKIIHIIFDSNFWAIAHFAVVIAWVATMLLFYKLAEHIVKRANEKAKQ
jgi:hypothetical protein